MRFLKQKSEKNSRTFFLYVIAKISHNGGLENFIFKENIQIDNVPVPP